MALPPRGATPADRRSRIRGVCLVVVVVVVVVRVWGGAMVLEVVHETRYDYAAPVSLAHHLAHLQPLDDAQQCLLTFQLSIDPPPDQ